VNLLKSKKIENIEKKIEQLKAQKATEEARIRAKAKKDDTRRKILIGAYFLEQAEKNGTMDDLKNRMNSFLTRPNDRALFDLTAAPTPPPSSSPTNNDK
jgi:hypothetical protein